MFFQKSCNISSRFFNFELFIFQANVVTTVIQAMLFVEALRFLKAAWQLSYLPRFDFLIFLKTKEIDKFFSKLEMKNCVGQRKLRSGETFHFKIR